MLSKKYGLLFPGQGSQEVGMGKELYETSAAARWVYDKADEVLGYSIKKLCFEGPEADLTTTANSQPAIFTTSMAILNVLIEKVKGSPVGEMSREFFSPEETAMIGSVSLGLSLGEPTALVAAGSISFEDGLRFVQKRGLFMEEASRREEGKMASIIGLDLPKIEEICKGVGCQVANLNCPGQVVISGPAMRVELAADLAKTAGAQRAIMLKVSGAFHSKLMLPAKEKLQSIVKVMEIKQPVIDFISNIDGAITRDPSKIKENLVNQLDNKTLWELSVRNAVANGCSEFLEIGPGAVLKGLAKRIDEKVKVTPLHTSADIDLLLSGAAAS